MHLGNGAITPECAALTTGLAAAGLTAASIALKREGLSLAKLGQAASGGCLIFAAQAVNMPIGTSTSAHLVGGVVLAWLVGPALGIWTMALVLALQALLLGDGGLLALGANTVNMAIVPAAAWLVANRALGRATAVNAGLAALASVPLAAGLIVLETAAFRSVDALVGWSQFGSLMLGTHLLIGVLEAAATASVVAVAAARDGAVIRRPGLVAAACAFAILVVLALPISSALPDGYEAAAAASGLEWLLAN